MEARRTEVIRCLTLTIGGQAPNEAYKDTKETDFCRYELFNVYGETYIAVPHR